MANICTNFITISGDEEQLEALLKRLLEQEPSLLETIPNFEIAETDFSIYNEGDIDYEGDSDIQIRFGSKWNCPVNDIASLSIEYPELQFNIHYEECGCANYGEIQIWDGSIAKTELNERQYCEKYNEEYKEQLEQITSSTYEDFLKDYSHGGFDEYPYSYLDRNIVDRIKDTDLPLFINRQWMDPKARETYKLRLSGGSTVEPQ